MAVRAALVGLDENELLAVRHVRLSAQQEVAMSKFVAFCVGCILLGSLPIGIERGVRIKTDPYIGHTLKLKTGDIEGRIVRSGEHGLLFFEPKKKQFTFQTWDNIQEIVYAAH
jgi:hypothetical protein